MARVRTTISLEPEVYAEAGRHLQSLGFTRLGDLINAAVRDYLHRRKTEERLRIMAKAGRDRRYRKVVGDVTRDFKSIDNEDFGTDY